MFPKQSLSATYSFCNGSVLRESKVFSIAPAVLNATDTSPDSMVSIELSFVLLMCATLVVVHVSL